MVAWLAPALGAVGAIGGALLGSRDNNRTNRANARSVEATNEMQLQATRETNKLSKEMWKKSREWEVADTNKQFIRLRNAAEKAGFNPLTAMGAFQGPQTVGTPALVTPQYQTAVAKAYDWGAAGASIGQSLGGVADALTGQAAVDQANLESRTQLNRVRADQIRAQIRTGEIPHRPGLDRIGARPSSKNPPPAAPEATEWGGTRPQARPTSIPEGHIPVRMPDGNQGSIPKGMADRLGIEPWGTVMMEDYEAVMGDVGGQVVGAPRIPGAAREFEGRNYGGAIEEILKPMPQLGPQRPATKYNNPDPEPGWMDRKFGR